MAFQLQQSASSTCIYSPAILYAVVAASRRCARSKAVARKGRVAAAVQPPAASSGTLHKLSATRPSTSITAISGKEGQKINVLFVCLGNICRSPTAEAVFKERVTKAKLEEYFFVDSCGLGGGNEDWYLDRGWAYHEGDQADKRMRETAASRGVTLTSRSRPLRHEDLTTFDYILGMDFENMANIQLAADHWADRHDIPNNYRDKVSLMCQHLPTSSQYTGTLEVPDPYFDDDSERRGFHRVLDLLNDACDGLLNNAIEKYQLQAQE